MAVFTDQFKNLEQNINRVANEAKVFDVLYTYFAERWDLPEFNFNPKLDIKILLFGLTTDETERTPFFIKHDFLKFAYIDRVSNTNATVQSVTDEIKSLFLDKERQLSLSKLGRQRMENKFNWAKAAKGYEEIYVKTIEEFSN